MWEKILFFWYHNILDKPVINLSYDMERGSKIKWGGIPPRYEATVLCSKNGKVIIEQDI